MAQCLYPYCKVGEANNYYRIPTDESLRKKWMSVIPQVLNLSKDSLNKRSFLCSKHFDPNSYTYGPDGKRKGLKVEAVPSIFYIPSESSKGSSNDVELEESDDDHDSPVEKAETLHFKSHYDLYLKVRHQEMKLLICKEKCKQEEEQIEKAQEKLKTVKKGDMPQEVAETYLKVLKKMRPLAPRKPQKKRPRTLEEVITQMQKEKSLSEEALVILLYLFADIHPADPSLCATSDGLLSFAQYMTFYNSEVYENLPSTFDIYLPPIASVRNVFQKISGEPGWSKAAFSALKEQLEKQRNKSALLCSLLESEMSLKRKEEWDGCKIRGYVDCGSQSGGFNMDADGLPSARAALVLMVVPLDPKQLWRIPIAYFFISRLTGAEKANIIRECILRLHAINVVVLSVTCDLFSCDKILLDSLGVSIDLLPHICPYFVNPADSLLRVQVVFDRCSLLTSVRNMWANSKGFKDSQGRHISWKFVSELFKLQETQAGSFTETYDVPIWFWDSPYFKNRLLSQLFSASTADAIEYCSNVLKLTQFDECAGTVHFIRMMSKISVLLKSRRFIEMRSNSSIKSEYVNVIDYLRQLKDEKYQALHSANCGSIRFLYQTLMSCQELLRQVPGFSAHCVSLDEVELLFYNIRSYIGWSAIPTARQFSTAFSTHVGKYGYCTSWNCAQTNSHWWIDSLDVSVARMEGRLVSKPEIDSCSLPISFDSKILFEYLLYDAELNALSVHNVLAICIVKTLADILHCDACLLALQDTYTTDNPLLLLLRKTCGALLFPSKDVLKVCAVTEHHLQLALKTLSPSDKMSIYEWRNEIFATSFGTIVMKDLLEKRRGIFSNLEQHHLDCAPDASHLYRLVRGISYCYVLMRLRRFKSWCRL